MKIWLKFNAWKKSENDNLRIYANAGCGKQKFNPLWLNAEPLNRFGKLPDNAKMSDGMDKALNGFFKSVEPDFIFKKDDLKPHGEDFAETFCGTFCITDIATIMGQNVGSDGLYLVKIDNENAKVWHCDSFFNFEE